MLWVFVGIPFIWHSDIHPECTSPFLEKEIKIIILYFGCNPTLYETIQNCPQFISWSGLLLYFVIVIVILLPVYSFMLSVFSTENRWNSKRIEKPPWLLWGLIGNVTEPQKPSAAVPNLYTQSTPRETSAENWTIKFT